MVAFTSFFAFECLYFVGVVRVTGSTASENRMTAVNFSTMPTAHLTFGTSSTLFDIALALRLTFDFVSFLIGGFELNGAVTLASFKIRVATFTAHVAFGVFPTSVAGYLHHYTITYFTTDEL